MYTLSVRLTEAEVHQLYALLTEYGEPVSDDQKSMLEKMTKAASVVVDEIADKPLPPTPKLADVCKRVLAKGLSDDSNKPGYFAVCYGHQCRWEKANNAREAARLAFGIVDSDRMTVRRFPANPKYTPLKTRTPWLNDLYARHEEKTGSKIG